MSKKIIIICGPTASGKSRFALNLAREKNGAIINADSLQIYNSLPLITASPSADDKKLVPHFLYNFLDPEIRYSVAHFIDDCRKSIENSRQNNLLPIITGGTGMYINALMQGISLIPEIDKGIREEVATIYKNEGIEFLYNKLAKIDPEAAAKLNISDSQRIIRSYEVKYFTGKSILEFQKKNHPALLSDFDVTSYYIKPERKILYKNCEERFLSIIDSGAIEEIKRFINKYPTIETGPTKALGFAEIKDYLQNKVSLPEAISLAQTRTRQYAKRQLTWFNNQLFWEHQIIT